MIFKKASYDPFNIKPRICFNVTIDEDYMIFE